MQKKLLYEVDKLKHLLIMLIAQNTRKKGK
jgi:hypothetical protein